MNGVCFSGKQNWGLQIPRLPLTFFLRAPVNFLFSSIKSTLASRLWYFFFSWVGFTMATWEFTALSPIILLDPGLVEETTTLYSSILCMPVVRVKWRTVDKDEQKVKDKMIDFRPCTSFRALVWRYVCPSPRPYFTQALDSESRCPV